MLGFEVTPATFFIAYLTLIIAICSVNLTIWIRRNRKRAKLRETGQRVTVRVTGVSRKFVDSTTQYGIFSRSGFRFERRVEAEWTDPVTGSYFRFKSRPLSRSAAKSYSVGEDVTVFVDSQNPENYWMDIRR